MYQWRRRAAGCAILALLIALPGCIGRSVDIGKPTTSDEWVAVKHVQPGRGVYGGLYTDIDFTDARHGWVACLEAGGLSGPTGVGNNIIATTDGGVTWDPQQAEAVELDFVGQIGWAVDGLHTTVARTADGGATWVKQPFTPRDELEIAAVSETEAWAISTAADRLFHTRDGGRTWRSVVLPLSGRPNFHCDGLQFLDQQHGWLLGSVIGGQLPHPTFLLRTEDAGNTFEVVNLAGLMDSTSTPHPIRFRTADDGWIPAFDGSLIHTVDGGKSWTKVTPRIGGRKVGGYSDCCFISAQEGWAVGGDSEGHPLAIHTADGGRTWRRSMTGMEPLYETSITHVVFTDPTHGWAIGNGGQEPSDMPQTQPDQVAFVLRYPPKH